jgi:hypothetical protein
MGFFDRLFGKERASAQERGERRAPVESKEMRTNTEVLTESITNSLFDTGKVAHIQGSGADKRAAAMDMARHAIGLMEQDPRFTGEWKDLPSAEFVGERKNVLVAEAIGLLEAERQETEAKSAEDAEQAQSARTDAQNIAE